MAAKQVGAELMNAQLAGRQLERTIDIAGNLAAEIEVRKREAALGAQLR